MTYDEFRRRNIDLTSDKSTDASVISSEGINSLGTTIGPIVVALILFGSTPKTGTELDEMIKNGSSVYLENI